MARRRAERTKKRTDGNRRQVQHPVIPLLKRHEVQVLRRAGLSRPQVEELTGVPRRSVQRIEEEASIGGAAARGRRAGGRMRLDGRRRRGQREPMHSRLLRHEVQVLRRAGLDRAKVQALTGVPVRSIRRIDEEEPITSLDPRDTSKVRPGRPSKSEPYRAFIETVLKDEPELMSLEILRRAKLKGYAGSKTALYDLIASLRPPKQAPVVRFEGLPGEFSQHDFGHVDVRFVDGRIKRVHFFASRLKYSRWAEVTLVEDEGVESLVRSLVAHFDAMGGVPLLAVFDRPKTVVLKWNKDGDVVEYNPTFAAVMLDLGVGIELCWPRSGWQKGSVERIVGWVKSSFFKQRRFVDEDDLRQQLAAWHEEINTRVPSRATGVTPAVRLAEERARMRPLQLKPNDLALRIPIVVGVTGMVVYHTHLYSMAPESIGLSGTLYLYKDKVRIIAGRFSAEHERLFVPHAKSVLPQHRAEMVAAVSGKRAKRYYKREQLLGLGAIALEYLTELVHRKPRTWAGDVDDLYELLTTYGDGPLLRAMELALGETTFGAEYVAHFLHQSLMSVARIGSQERVSS
jgi:transposase